MSIKLVLSLLALSGLAGIALGYVLRLLIALGQRGSLELEVKQKLLEARDRASRIIHEAEAKAEERGNELSIELDEREGRLEKTEDRLVKREEFLDERERALSEESDEVRTREHEVNRLKKEVDEVLNRERHELSQLANLSEEEARARLIKDVEKAYEGSILARLQKT